MLRFHRIIKLNRGHNCRDFKCAYGDEHCNSAPCGDHGAHGMEIFFGLRKGNRGVSFTLCTGWVPFVKPQHSYFSSRDLFHTYPISLSYHSRSPVHPDDHKSICDCVITQTSHCYGDSYYNDAEECFFTLINAGEEAMWAYLEEFYNHIFHNAASPSPVPYPQKERKNVSSPI